MRRRSEDDDRRSSTWAAAEADRRAETARLDARWPLSDEEKARRAEADRVADEHRDSAYNPECDVCQAMRRACGNCIYRFLHPEVGAFIPEARCETCGGRAQVVDPLTRKFRPCPECNAPAPPYPGLVPGGLAERILAEVRARGPRERPSREADDASRAFWASITGKSPEPLNRRARRAAEARERRVHSARVEPWLGVALKEAAHREAKLSAAFWAAFLAAPRRRHQEMAEAWAEHRESIRNLNSIERAAAAEAFVARVLGWF